MEEKTVIEFHGGLDTIGGNIIALEFDNYRIITDFGAVVGVDINELSYQSNTESLYQSEKLPQIEGVYRQEGLKDTASRLSYENSQKETIVLISHLHLDHVGSLAHLHPDIKVYATDKSVNLYQSLKKHSFLPDYPVNWQAVREGETIEHGPFSIQFHLSDHDTEGAAAIFITAPDLKIIYSGDLRLSGFHPERVMEWAIKARQFQPDILLLEGTSYSFSDEIEPSELDKELTPMIEDMTSPTEFGLMREIQILIEESDHLIAFNGYPQNIERIQYLAELSQKNQRLLVLQPDLYNLVTSNLGQFDNIVPLASETNQFGVTVEVITKEPHRYVLQVDEFTYEMLYTLPQGIILHSNGVPLGSFMAGYEAYIKGLNQHGWRIINASVSGHASKEDLLTVAYTVQANITIPWHTKFPELYSQALESYGVTTFLPQYHMQYTLDEIRSISRGG